MSYNNNHAGIHMIHLGAYSYANHEFDYDNQMINKRCNKPEVQLQTGLWSMDGKPVNIKQVIKQRRKEQSVSCKHSPVRTTRKESERKFVKQSVPLKKSSIIIKEAGRDPYTV